MEVINKTPLYMTLTECAGRDKIHYWFNPPGYRDWVRLTKSSNAIGQIKHLSSSEVNKEALIEYEWDSMGEKIHKAMDFLFATVYRNYKL
jgi:hypothetical protein